MQASVAEKMSPATTLKAVVKWIAAFRAGIRAVVDFVPVFDKTKERDKKVQENVRQK